MWGKPQEMWQPQAPEESPDQRRCGQRERGADLKASRDIGSTMRRGGLGARRERRGERGERRQGTALWRRRSWLESSQDSSGRVRWRLRGNPGGRRRNDRSAPTRGGGRRGISGSNQRSARGRSGDLAWWPDRWWMEFARRELWWRSAAEAGLWSPFFWKSQRGKKGDEVVWLWLMDERLKSQSCCSAKDFQLKFLGSDYY